MYLPAEIILKAIDKATGPLKRIGLSFKLMSKDTRASLQAVGGTARRLGLSVAAAAAAVMIATGKASATQEALLDRLSAEGVKDLEAIRQKAEEVSDEVAGIEANQFLEAMRIIVRGLPQLGGKVAAAVGEITAKTAAAVGVNDFDRMNESFVKFHKNWKEKFPDLSEADFAKFFGGFVSGGVEFGLAGEDMLKLLDGVGAKAAAAGQDIYEVFAVAGRLGSEMKNPKQAVAATEELMKGLSEGGKKLGLPFLTADRQLKPLPAILALIRQKYGETIDQIEKEDLSEAFGGGAEVIQILLKSMDKLPGDASRMREAFSLAGFDKMLAKLEAQQKGMGDSSSRVMQRLKNLAVAVGEILNPVLLPLIDRTAIFLKQLREWARENPELTKALILGAFVFGGLTAAIGMATLAMMAFNLAAWSVGWKFALIVLAIAGLVAAVFYLRNNWREVWENVKAHTVGIVGWMLAALGLIVAWNPATWGLAAVIAGVAALAIAAVWLYENWEGVLAWFAEGWEDVKTAAGAFWDWLKDAADNFLAIFNVDDWVEAGGRIIGGLWEGIKSVFGKITDWFKGAVGGLLSLVPDSLKSYLGLKVEAERAPAAVGPRETSLWANDRPLPVEHAWQDGREEQPRPKSKIDGRIVVDFRNAPKGTRITELRETGDTDIDLSVGLNTVGMMP